MEEKFEIQKVIEKYGLNAEELAPKLFPRLKYPNAALTRVLTGQDSLEVRQLEALADYIGIPVSDLFTAGYGKVASDDGHLLFIINGYKVRINYNGAFLTVYNKDNNIISKEVACYAAMSFKEFINHITNIIKNYEDGNN